MRTLLAIAAVATLCACGDRQPKEDADYGAAQAARIALQAERECVAAGFGEELEACAKQPGPNAGRAARVALMAESDYMRMCTSDLGRDKCKNMLDLAYLVVQK